MTMYINLEEKPTIKTVFTHYLSTERGWAHSICTPKEYYKVVYLGNSHCDGDMFACYRGNEIIIYKGIKGDEF